MSGLIDWFKSLFGGSSGEARKAYKPAGEQQVFDGHLCRGWDLQSDKQIDGWLNAAVKTGYTGIDIELAGSAPSFNSDGGSAIYKANGGVLAYHVKMAKSVKLKYLLGGCRKRKLWLYIRDFNTNDKALKGLKDLNQFAKVHQAVMELGVQGVMRCPMNEDDGNTDANIRERYEDLVAASVSDNQSVATFQREGWAVYAEYHPSKIAGISSLPSGAKNIVASDNGTIIDEMTDGSTLGGDGTANSGQHVRFFTEALKRGMSASNYAFLKRFQPQLQAAVGPILKGKV